MIRVDPIGGASDVQRWPLSADGTSIYWTGLNKGKRSATIDLRSAEGQELVQRLIVAGDGIVLTNAVLPSLSHELLAAKRSDVIHVQLLGRGDGSTGVDYTVNAAIGYPLVTGPAEYAGAGCKVVMPWAAQIGSAKGIINRDALKLLRDRLPDITLDRRRRHRCALACGGSARTRL